MPDKPVPMVKANKFDPKETPEIVLLDKAAFGILLKVFSAPLIVLPVSVPGMSSLTSKRKAVVAAAPDVGPAYT